MSEVAVAYDRIGDLPVEAEAVVSDAGVVGRLVHGGGLVNHDGIRFQTEKSVGKAGGDVKDVPVFGAELHGGALSMGGGCLAEVQDDILHAAADAVDQFGVVMRGQLEVHAAEDALTGG